MLIMDVSELWLYEAFVHFHSSPGDGLLRKMESETDTDDGLSLYIQYWEDKVPLYREATSWEIHLDLLVIGGSRAAEFCALARFLPDPASSTRKYTFSIASAHAFDLASPVAV